MAKLILNDGRTYDVPEIASSWVDGVDGHVLVIPSNLALSIGMMIRRWMGDPKGLADVRMFAYRTTDDRERVIADLRRAMESDEETIARARAEMVDS